MDRHDLLRQGYAAVSARDFDSVAGLLGEDFEFEPGEQSPLAGRTLRGPAELMEAMRENAELFEAVSYSPERIIDVDENRAIVLVRIAARPHGGSQDVNIQIAHLWTFNADAPRALKVHTRPEDAFDAVGLPPQRLPADPPPP